MYAKTADGYAVEEGDSVFIQVLASTPDQFESMTIKKVHSKLKVEFTEETTEGYIGARTSVVWKQIPESVKDGETVIRLITEQDIRDIWGDKCPDYSEACLCCIAWKVFDDTCFEKMEIAAAATPQKKT